MVQLECCCTLVFKSGAASLVSVDRQKFAVSFLDRTCCSERFSSFCKQISLFSSSMTEDKLQGESCSGFRTFPGFRVKQNGMAIHLLCAIGNCSLASQCPCVHLSKCICTALTDSLLCFLVNMSDAPPVAVTDRFYSFCLETITGIIEVPKNIFGHLYLNLCTGSKTLWQSFKPDSWLNSFFKVQ